MTKFRKKPIVIDAIQWTGNNWDEIKTFADLHVMAVDKKGYFSFSKDFDKDTMIGIGISTLEGFMTCDKGDWVIKGVIGEFYPCKPDIFDKTYEKVVGLTDSELNR